LAENQQLQVAPNGFTLTASLPYSWRLRWWILSKTGDIQIMEPQELRTEIGELLRSAASHYGSALTAVD
jgi:predicted DNA-binding transcriptional regulator YafY